MRRGMVVLLTVALWSPLSADENSDYEFAFRLYQEGDYETARDEFDLFLRQYPHSEHADDALFLSAESARLLRNNDEAVRKYRRLLNDYPASPLRLDALLGVAQAVFDQGKYEESVLAFDEVFRRNDDPKVRSLALSLQAEAYSRIGDYTRALELYDRLLGQYPDAVEYPSALYAKGWTLFQLKRYREAYEALRSFLVQYENAPEAPEAAYRAAEALFYAEEFKNARELYNAFVEKYQSDAGHQSLVADAELRIGQCLFREGEFEEARAQLRRVAQRYPTLDAAADAQYWTAELLFEAKRYNEALYEYRRFLEAYPQNPNAETAQYSIGRVYFAMGDYPKAIAALEPLANDLASPLRDAAAFHIAECRRLAKEFNTAILWYRRVEGSSPYYDDALFGMGGAYLELNDNSRAAEAFERLLTVESPLRRDALYQLAIAQFREKAYEKAIAILDRFLAEPGKSLATTDGALYWQVRAHYELHAHAEAAQTARRLLEAFPNSEHAPAARFLLGESLYGQKDYAGARAQYEVLFQTHPQSEWAQRARYQIGWTYFAEAQAHSENPRVAYSRAVETWKQIAADPKTPPLVRAQALYDLGVAQINLHQYDAAIASFNDLLTRFPASDLQDDAQYMVAWASYLKGDYARAATAFDEMLRRHPSSPLVPQAILYKANAFFKQGRYNDAITEYTRVRDTYPSAEIREGDRRILIRERAQYQIGESYYNLRDYKRAIEAYQQLQSLYPTSLLADDAQFAIASAYQLTGDLKAANDAFKELTERYPESDLAPDTLRTIGINLFDQKQFQQAIAQFQEVITRYPNSKSTPLAQYDIGRAYYELRSYPQAVQAFEAVAKYPQASGDVRASALYFAAWALRDPNNSRRDIGRAIATLQKLLQEYPQAAETPRAYLLLAELFASTNQLEEAVKAYRDLIAEKPNTEEAKAARVDLGNTLLRLKRYADAAKAFEPVTEEPNKYPADVVVKAQLGLGDAYANLRRYEDAAKAYLVVALIYAEKAPFEALQGLCRAGDAYEKANRTAQAIRWYEKALNDYERRKDRTDNWKPFLDFARARLDALRGIR